MPYHTTGTHDGMVFDKVGFRRGFYLVRVSPGPKIFLSQSGPLAFVLLTPYVQDAGRGQRHVLRETF
jgi:hypothetical protein